MYTKVMVAYRNIGVYIYNVYVRYGRYTYTSISNLKNERWAGSCLRRKKRKKHTEIILYWLRYSRNMKHWTYRSLFWSVGICVRTYARHLA